MKLYKKVIRLVDNVIHKWDAKLHLFLCYEKEVLKKSQNTVVLCHINSRIIAFEKLK